MPVRSHPPDFTGKVLRFAEKVRRRRGELGLSERALAAQAEVDRSVVTKLLKGRARDTPDENGEYGVPNPTLDLVWRLADALEVDVSYLVDDSRPVENGLPRRKA